MIFEWMRPWNSEVKLNCLIQGVSCWDVSYESYHKRIALLVDWSAGHWLVPIVVGHAGQKLITGPATRDLILASPGPISPITSHLSPTLQHRCWRAIVLKAPSHGWVLGFILWSVFDNLVFPDFNFVRSIQNILSCGKKLTQFNFVQWCIYTFLPRWTQSLNTLKAQLHRKSCNTTANFKLSLVTHHTLKLTSDLGMSFTTIFSLYFFMQIL